MHLASCVALGPLFTETRFEVDPVQGEVEDCFKTKPCWFCFHMERAFLPTYPTLIAAVEMDDTGSTRIGKYVFNHPFLVPGVIAISLSVLFGFLMAGAVL